MNNFDHEFQVALDRRFRILDRVKYKETRMVSVVRMGICLILSAVCGIVGADDTKPDVSQWSSTVVTENGQLAVEGIQLVNQKGDPVVLRGVSFGWSNWWSQFYNEGAVNWLVNDWHCTVIRASMGVGPQGSYLDRPEWSKKLITTVVDSAIKNDVYVIIDWHDHHAHQRTDDDRVYWFANVSFKSVVNQE